mmetsp:Transcript_20387/g.39399  ORF Transcript_20387/g.39399 Transcript_20387/m.39399 type:complete len:93 (-) Transcript_20387:414-692(-)
MCMSNYLHEQMTPLLSTLTDPGAVIIMVVAMRFFLIFRIHVNAHNDELDESLLERSGSGSSSERSDGSSSSGPPSTCRPPDPRVGGTTSLDR